MKARILSKLDRVTSKAPTCVLCGEKARGWKSRFQVEVSCGYKADIWICRNCSGEEGAMRTGEIELPYAEAHYHVEGRKEFTFWNYEDTLNWAYEFMQRPPAQEIKPGIHIIDIANKTVKFFRCEGKKLPAEGANMTA